MRDETIHTPGDRAEMELSWGDSVFGDEWLTGLDQVPVSDQCITLGYRDGDEHLVRWGHFCQARSTGCGISAELHAPRHGPLQCSSCLFIQVVPS